jgi:hypothetical protein
MIWKAKYLIALLPILILGCNRTFDPVPEHLATVFPLHEGSQRVYEVAETSYVSINSVDAFHFFRRETIEGTESDLLGREVSKMFLYDSPDTLDSLGNRFYQWSFEQLWTQYANDDWAERIEGNIRYVVLKRPPVEGTSWNGNLYNSGDVETYKVVSHDTTITVPAGTFEHCVFVLQVPYRRLGVDMSPSTPLFIEEYAYEVYAPGIGKIERYRKYIEVQSGTIFAGSHVYYEVLQSHN